MTWWLSLAVKTERPRYWHAAPPYPKTGKPRHMHDLCPVLTQNVRQTILLCVSAYQRSFRAASLYSAFQSSTRISPYTLQPEPSLFPFRQDYKAE
jgi:hypothetical protein